MSSDLTAAQILAIIPARGGSKGIPRKNVRPLAGKPLIAHTIEQAQHSRLVTRVVVSTDDQEIKDVSTQYGAEVILRPAEISGDTASSESALTHVLQTLKERDAYQPDLVVFLQCTSPIRQEDDIDRAIEKLQTSKADSVLSVVPFHTFIWRQIGDEVMPIDFDFRKRPRRQDRHPEFIENGCIYVFKPWVLEQFNNRLGGHIAVYEMSRLSVDIDTVDDFDLCEAVMQHIHKVT